MCYYKMYQCLHGLASPSMGGPKSGGETVFFFPIVIETCLTINGLYFYLFLFSEIGLGTFEMNTPMVP